MCTGQTCKGAGCQRQGFAVRTCKDRWCRGVHKSPLGSKTKENLSAYQAIGPMIKKRLPLWLLKHLMVAATEPRP